jgi:hypothetical protein
MEMSVLAFSKERKSVFSLKIRAAALLTAVHCSEPPSTSQRGDDTGGAAPLKGIMNRG